MARADSPTQPDSPSFESSPHNWDARGWAALDAATKRWVDAGLGSSLWIRTHASHIVSDAPSATRFVRSWQDHGVRLVYDLISMITPAMAGSLGLADFLSRRIDALTDPGLAQGVAFVLVSNFRFNGTRIYPSPIDDGQLDPELLRATIPVCTGRGIDTAILHSDRQTELSPRVAGCRTSTAIRPPYTPPRVN